MRQLFGNDAQTQYTFLGRGDSVVIEFHQEITIRNRAPNKGYTETVRVWFPSDFIAEGLDQTRGWFYTLMVLSTALFDKPAFKNVVVNGLVLADGSPDEIIKDENVRKIYLGEHFRL